MALMPLLLFILVVIFVVILVRRFQAAEDKGAALGGAASIGAIVVGFLGVLFGLIALLGGHWGSMGMPLIASAIAFGLLANAIHRR